MLRKLLPHPGLTVLLILTWLMLVNEFKWGSLVFATLLGIILPLMTPALATTAVFTTIWLWNDFFASLIYLTSPDKFTVPLALRAFLDAEGSSEWGPMFAMSVLSLLPMFLVFLVGQRFLVRGIATTGLR